MNVTIDASALCTTALLELLSVLLGLGWFIAALLASGFFEIGLAFVKAVAGERGYEPSYEPSAMAVAIRAFVYFAACVAALVLAALGHTLIAYILAVAGGLALGIALGKFVERIR